VRRVDPVAVDGPCLTIRRFSTRPMPLDAFAPPPVASLLRELVARRCNLLVSGATSSGKTTLLNALAREHRTRAPADHAGGRRRAALPHPHVVRLETREATPTAWAKSASPQLLRTALRLRPDRLVVGEIRGSEAVHLLQALNTGHDGSLSTVHANSSLDALDRLATLVVQEVANWPLAAVHQHVSRAIDAVVHVVRGADGRRLVAEVVEVVPSELGAALSIRVLADGRHVLAPPQRGRG
jgi:pilus assembly protein CpaF